MNRSTLQTTLRFALALSLTLAFSLEAPAGSGPMDDDQPGRAASESDLDPAWFASPRDLPDRDRVDVVERIGWTAPEFPRGAELRENWYGTGAPMTWEDVRGRVVVVQTFNSRGGTGIRRATQAEEAFGPSNDDVALLLLHTPELRPRVLDSQVRKSDIRSPIYLDKSGAFCDRFGVYKKPVTIVIDRHGVVRGAGMTLDGAKALIEQLNQEPYDPDRRGAARPVAKPRPGTGEYPPITGAIPRAKDVRGEKLHQLNISQWQTAPEPTIVNRILVVDFWATWCVQCVKDTPHMAELQKEFVDDVVIIALSKESPERFAAGMRKLGKSAKSLGIHVALDAGGLTGSSIFLQAIPHVVVVGRDGIVRWQGLSSRLTAEILRQIIEAEGQLPAAGRWAESLAAR